MLNLRQRDHGGKGVSHTRPMTKAVAVVAALSLVASMCPGAAVIAYANDKVAGGAEDSGNQVLTIGGVQQGAAAGISAQADDDVPSRSITVNYETNTMSGGAYRVHKNDHVTIKPDWSGNGIRVEKGASVLLYIDEGASLTVTGADANGSGVGRAAILLPEGSTLTIAGGGTLNVTGGKAGRGETGGGAEASNYKSGRDPELYVGKGGNGGAGGGGAGAGIGTDGGAGGKGGVGGFAYESPMTASNEYGCDGHPGSMGSQAAQAGTVIVKGSVTVNANGGAAGEGGDKGARGQYAQHRDMFKVTSVGTSGGGGGGGGGSAADGIGSGGSGGGGGGGGASANIDGEGTCFGDLDDLWSHGGNGGSGVWGGGSGTRGDEGASNDGDSNGEYAKAGGAGGTSPTPSTVSFYTYAKDGQPPVPTVTCTSGHGVARNATPLASLDDYKAHGGYVAVRIDLSIFSNKSMTTINMIGKLILALDKIKEMLPAQPQPGSSSAVEAQAEGDGANDGIFSGTTDVDGTTVSYSVVYYDEAGNKLESEPMLPGRYTAIATLESDNPDYNGEFIVPFDITKRQVAKPTPAELVFKCADWGTGEGAEQEAFPELNSDDYEFVADAEAPEGIGDLTSNASLKSAKEAGSYAACFRLKDPSTCQWEGEPEDAAEAWIPWSVKLQEFDPNDVSYWGTAYDNAKTTVAYTGEPQWVRPWFTYAKDTNGRFPEWLTHWGSSDQPKDDKNSAVVVYLQGEDDEQGLVGYHTGADGSLEPVTGAQIYAWANGVDINGRHVDVNSGDKVWYKVGSEGWYEPLAVQEDKPDGADGFVVARDYGYVDKFGVKDVGTYKAYAFFDEGAGFAPTALAEATVEVTKADASKQPKTQKAASSTTAKTGDASSLAIAGGALAALVAAAALALALRRRSC